MAADDHPAAEVLALNERAVRLIQSLSWLSMRSGLSLDATEEEAREVIRLLRAPAPDEQASETIINHEEARMLANLRRAKSNLARCYLDLANKNPAPGDAVTEAVDALLSDLAQLLDGWHTDCAWTEWDESVRKRITEVRAALRARAGA